MGLPDRLLLGAGRHERSRQRAASSELYLANPVTLAVLGFQRTFWISGATPARLPRPPRAQACVIAFVVGVVLLVSASGSSRGSQGNFAQEL